ncbi:hypothetical protein VTN77DRAFT_4559 [Rasamsonia byssochlamydoides]|uniref:uncharacterized protein n=1 Tax=Rasamsonia byssochlamydoides TaxID=89139 RepID=UPI003742A212
MRPIHGHVLQVGSRRPVQPAIRSISDWRWSVVPVLDVVASRADTVFEYLIDNHSDIRRRFSLKTSFVDSPPLSL